MEMIQDMKSFVFKRLFVIKSFLNGYPTYKLFTSVYQYKTLLVCSELCKESFKLELSEDLTIAPL